MAKFAANNLQFVREDDYVEYFIFPTLPEELGLAPTATLADDELQQLQKHLELARANCQEIVERLVKERQYIWHKDEFQLLPRIASAQELMLNEEISADAAQLLPPHLHGVTHFGDNAADEWFVVYLLYELSREMSGCIVRVVDSDGEFLLIEAADSLPKWASPDTCEQRVYIFGGKLQLVQNSPTNTSKLLPVASAVSKIRLNPTLYRVPKKIENCIDDRIKEFKTLEAVQSNQHQQIVRIPVGIAALLKKRPALIASAVRAFCERDPIDMKACRKMCFFPPEQRVRMNVRFTRCVYAMVMHSNYLPDRKIGWNLNAAINTEEYKEDLLGVKIACGFEILASQAKDTNVEENEPAWRAYVRSLQSKGYFRDNIEGSQEYNRLLADAKSYYSLNNKRFRTVPLVGREILDLLHSIDINAEQMRDEENNLEPSDSDDWLNITAEQLDSMMFERYGTKKLYKSNGDINAEEFTKNITEFLEKQSEFDGIGSDDDDDDNDDDDNGDGDGEDSDDENVEQQATSTKHTKQKNAEFRAKVKKNHSMRKACKNNPIIDNCSGSSKKQQTSMKQEQTDESFTTQVRNFLDFVIPEDKWDSNSEMSDYENDEDLERNFEAMTSTEMNIDVDIRKYMAQMDKELSQTTIGKSFISKTQNISDSTTSASAAAVDDDFDDIESFKPININVNTLKNMMDSYKSQLGGAGPVSSLFNAMGVGMSAAAAMELEEEEQATKKDLSESAV